MPKDLDAAKLEFWAAVESKNPKVSNVRQLYSSVLDELIAWSANQPSLQFTWHDGKSEDARQSLIKYCVEGMEDQGAFWAVYPKNDEVAFLIVLADDNRRFPADLRKEALGKLSAIDNRAKKPKKYPVVHFTKLKQGNLSKVLKLMEGWLPQVLPK